MQSMKLLFKFLRKNILKNLVITIQIIISIYVLTFVLIELISHFETSKRLTEMNFDNKVIFIESLHINTLLHGEERNEKYNDIKQYLSKLDGVNSVSSTYYTQLKNQDFNTYMYDNELIKSMHTNLKEGIQFKDYKDDKNVLPIIISESLENRYSLGNEYDFTIYKENPNEEIDFKVKVIGILNKGEYIYIGSAIQGVPELNDLFLKTSNDEKFILMPNGFENMNASYFTNGGFIIEHDGTIDFFNNSTKKVKVDGVGEFKKIDELETNFYSNLITNYDLYIFLFIITYIFVIASIGGYNLLETLRYKRLLTIYYINGMRWKTGILLIAIRNFLVIMIPTIISAYLFNKSLHDAGEYVFNIKVIFITCVLYMIVFIFTTIGSIITLKNTKPIEVLKEVE